MANRSDAHRAHHGGSTGSETLPHLATVKQITPPLAWFRVLTPGFLAGFGSVVVLIATLIVGLTNLRTVYRTSELVAHTYAVKAALQRLLATVVDADAGGRGFINAGATDHQEPYDRARVAITGDLAHVRTLVADDPAQQADLARLSAAAAARAAADMKTTELAGIRATIARMDAREDALLAARSAEAERSYRVASLTRYGTTALALLVVMGLFFIARRLGTERDCAAHTAERHRVTLASIGDAVIATDDQGRVTQMNAVAAALTGWTEAEAAGRPLEDVFVLINEQSRRPAENLVGRVLRDQVMVELADDTVLLSRDGREIAVDDQAAPIRTADGRVAGVVMVFRDVTERHRTDRERAYLLEAARVAKREAEHASRTKNEFLAVVSHELRTPLNTVLGWADMLRRGTLPESRRERAVEAVYTNAKRQVQLIDELLDTARIMAGTLRLERTATDLCSVVRAALDVVQPAADAKQIRVAVHADSSIGQFYGDATRLQQIFLNLLSNAVKFTPDRGAVHVRVSRVAGAVECVITDTGPGIPPDFLPFVFEPFRQVDGLTTRRNGGLGLGLSIVKQLVEAHGGMVRAESPGAGQGATFRVRLPIVSVDLDQADPASSSVTPAHAPIGGAAWTLLQGVTVLVVDDDADSREVLAASLEQFGAAVVTAASADRAVDLLKATPVHVLLADLAMPDEEAYTLVYRLRAREVPGIATIPAVALTSMARAKDRRHALQAGFQLHLAKPIDARALADALVTLLQPVSDV